MHIGKKLNTAGDLETMKCCWKNI